MIKCPDKNSKASLAFLNMKLITLPITPGRVANAFLANSCNQLEIVTRSRFTAFGGFGSGVGGETLGLADVNTDKIIVEIVIPMAVIIAPIVKPSLLNNSFNLSLNDLVLSLIISFTL